jgi:hypothetical protein
MATITTTGSGNWSSTTPNAPWPSGIVPVLGDKVTIATGHTVTVEGTYTTGDDTTTALTINGTLKASRSVSSSLTVRGEIVLNTGTFDYGTEADPIPSSVTATVVLNDSATMATQKYGLSTVNTVDFAGFRMWGADKTGKTSTTAAALSSDTVIPMADVTGWQNGDRIGFAPSVAGNSATSTDWRTITGISGNNVTINAALGVASQSGRDVFNVSRNVRFTCVQGNLYRSQVYLRFRAAAAITTAIEIGPCEFNLAGGETKGGGALTIEVAQFGFSTKTVVKKIYRPAFNPIWSISGSTVTTLSKGASASCNIYVLGAATPILMDGVTNCLDSVSTNNWYVRNSALTLNNCNVMGGMLDIIRGDGNGFGIHGVTVNNMYATGGVGSINGIVGGSAFKIDINNSTFTGVQQIFGTSLGSTLGITFNNCILGGVLGFYNTTTYTTCVAGEVEQATFNNCVFPVEPPIARTGTNINTTSSVTKFFFRNWNNDTTKQKQIVQGGIIYRDNSMIKRGLSSLALSPWYSGIPLTYTTKIAAAPGETVRVIGYLRFNAAYLTATPPAVTISGLGATPVSYTCTATADTWFQFDLSITNPQAYSGEFDFTVTAQSAANSTSPICWLDGVALTDMVPLTRHYGFLQNNSPKQTIDPNATLSEAAVVALTSVATLDDLYDECQYWTATNPQSGAYRLLVAATGTTLDFGANNIVVDGSAASAFAVNTGTNTITIKSSVLAAGTKFKTFTTTGSVSFINGASSSLPYTSSAGTVAIINVTGLVAGSRVYLKNTTNNTNLYNSVVAGTSLALPVLWTADKTIRLRVQYTNGTTSYLPVEQFGILTSSGASFVVSQAIDSVYAANAVNGSTVTEFSADYPNVQVDITDPDGITSVPRLYAWYRYNEFSASGIEFFQSGIVADDPANYQIHASIINLQLDNKNAAPVLIIGARLYRDDGTTIIYSGSGSIQLDPAKAYLAGGASIAADVRAALKPDFGLILAVSA